MLHPPLVRSGDKAPPRLACWRPPQGHGAGGDEEQYGWLLVLDVKQSRHLERDERAHRPSADEVRASWPDPTDRARVGGREVLDPVEWRGVILQARCTGP